MASQLKNKYTILFVILTKCWLLNGQTILKDNQVTDYGEWGNWERCPKDTYVVAFQLKVEPVQGSKDDTALNGIRLYCDKVYENTDDSPTTITSSVGPFGDWKKIFQLGGFMTGYQLRAEGLAGEEDDTSANNLRVFSKSLINKFQQMTEGDGLEWGKWLPENQCSDKQAVCGIQTQVEQAVAEKDDTALNNVKFECCEMKNPGETCSPTDAWDLVLACDNSEGLTELLCTFTKIIGVGTTTENPDIMNKSTSVIQALAKNFGTQLPTSSNTSHKWSKESASTWIPEFIEMEELLVVPGMKSDFYQVVGKCNYFNVHTTQFKRVDSFPKTGAIDISFL